ncbi:MAG: 2,3-bisphosphoglycerate-independent phosphoglycerate mutase [Nitrospirales bacterium]
MKYVILHGDGLADRPSPDLGGKTPLQAAATPNMDFLARHGELGLLAVPIEGPPLGSPQTALAILGQDPRKAFPGPAPFEAAGHGVALGDQDVAFRCTMVTLQAGPATGKGRARFDIKKLGPTVILEDDTAGGIETEEARELIQAVNEQIGSETIQFYPGTGHQHFMVWVGGKARGICHPPQEVLGKAVSDFLPSGDGADILRQLMDASLVILRDHPVNAQREEEGLLPVNYLWLWGQGRAPRLASLTDQYDMTGTILSASELHRGIGICAGLEALALQDLAEEGPVALRHLVPAAVRELQKKDVVYLHLEPPQSSGPGPDSKVKLKRLEDLDREVIGPLLKELPRLGAHRVILTCDHPDLAVDTGATGTLVLPYVLYEGPGGKKQNGKRGFNEVDARDAQPKMREATRLAARLFQRD